MGNSSRTGEPDVQQLQLQGCVIRAAGVLHSWVAVAGPGVCNAPQPGFELQHVMRTRRGPSTAKTARKPPARLGLTCAPRQHAQRREAGRWDSPSARRRRFSFENNPTPNASSASARNWVLRKRKKPWRGRRCGVRLRTAAPRNACWELWFLHKSRAVRCRLKCGGSWACVAFVARAW